MAGETNITIIGNLTADPELRFTPSGAAVANLTIASTPRRFDKQTNEWVDGETLFLRGAIWRDAAENVAETLQKGQRVIATGALKQRQYEKDGQTRTVVELEIDEIGPSLKWATARVNRADTRGGNNSGGGGNQSVRNNSQQSRGNAPQEDPWGANSSDDPPF